MVLKVPETEQACNFVFWVPDPKKHNHLIKFVYYNFKANCDQYT